MLSSDTVTQVVRVVESSINSTQSGCTLWLIISCAVLTSTTALVFGWGLGAPNMYTSYTELFLKGENPCHISYEHVSRLNQTLPIIDSRHQTTKRFNFLNELIKGIPQTIFLVGAFIGAFTGPLWLNGFDRKQGIYINYIFTFTSSLCMLLSYCLNHSWLFYLSRFLLGYQGGMACVVVPPYISEIASQRVRGAAGSVFRLSLTIGILIAQIIGMPFIAGNCYSWAWGLSIIFLLPFVGIFLLYFIPDSPTQMITIYSNEDQARNDLRKLRGTVHIQADIDVIQQQIQHRTNNNQLKSLSILQILTSDRYRWSMLTTVILQWSQAMSGINAVFFYSSKMFSKVGISLEMIPYANLGTGLINVIATAVSLLLIDRVGRRALILYPMAIMIAVFALLTLIVEYNEYHNNAWLGFIAIIFILIFIVCFSIGLGPIPFFYASEACRPEARDSIQALGFVANYLGNTLLSLFFPAFNSMFGGYVFLIFLLLLLLSLGFLWFKMPETKSSTIEDLEKFWKITSTLTIDPVLLNSMRT